MAASVGSDFKIEGTRPPSHDSKAQTAKDKETLLQGTNDSEEALGKMENGNAINHISGQPDQAYCGITNF